MSESLRDQKMCSIHHDKEIVFACFYMGCTQPFLCRICYRNHSEDHENDVQELSSVEKLESSLNSFQAEKDHILQQQQDINVQKDRVISQSKELITTMIDKIIKELQDRKQQLINCLLEHVNIERDDNTKDLFLKLESNFKTIKDFHLASEDIFKKITQVKAFNEEMLPATKNQIVEVTKVLETWKLDNSKLDLYEKELNYFLENLQFQDFLCDSSFRSLMHLDIPDTLKTAHQNLGLRSKVDILNEEIEKLKQDNQGLNEKLQESVQVNNQAKLDNNQLQNQVNNLSQEMQNLKYQNNTLNVKISAMQSEKNKLETDLKDLKVFIEFKKLSEDFLKDTSCGVKMTSGNVSLYYCKGSKNGCTASGKIWGSNPYTAGGNTCVETRHSGIIGDNGGFALRKVLNVAIPSFPGTTQHGITSESCGQYKNNVQYYTV